SRPLERPAEPLHVVFVFDAAPRPVRILDVRIYLKRFSAARRSRRRPRPREKASNGCPASECRASTTCNQSLRGGCCAHLPSRSFVAMGQPLGSPYEKARAMTADRSQVQAEGGESPTAYFSEVVRHHLLVADEEVT